MSWSALRKSLTLNCLIVFVVLFFARPAAATIKYQVSFEHPEMHIFHVTMTVPVQGNAVVIALPAWNALYQIRDFSYRVRDISVVCCGADPRPTLRPEQLTKDSWRISVPVPASQQTGTATVSYSIEWDDPGVFSSQLTDKHAFMNLAQILMYVPDRRRENTEVSFTNVPGGWNLAAELAAGSDAASFVASSYDTLVDAPVEAGKFDEFRFDSGGGHFRVIVDAASWNRNRLEDALRRITAYELQLMGGPPFQEYTFFFHIGPESLVGAGGGMEHANSAAIAAMTLDGAVSIASHEFFHVWNVKRIRPQSLEPVDYTKEQYTRALWFAEGVTDTYSSFTLERTGLWSRKQFYDDLASQIERVQFHPAHEWQSAEESSLDAWFEKYDGYNTPDRSISYYDKGQIIGVLLDLAIRDATDNHKSLDDVLRLMNDEYARKGKYYDDSNGVRAAVEEIAGKSFEDFFRRYVSGVDEIPYSDFLAVAGLELKTNSGYSISEIAHPNDRQRRIREGLLHGSTD
jgi:predicted metalloprotease with PDZ domain